MILFTILMIVLMVEQNCQLNSIYKDDIGVILARRDWDYDDFQCIPSNFKCNCISCIEFKNNQRAMT